MEEALPLMDKKLRLGLYFNAFADPMGKSLFAKQKSLV
jgi:hypothetical protein